MTGKLKPAAMPGDLDGLFDTEPVNKDDTPDPNAQAAASPDDSVTKGDDISYTPDQYEKATQKILKDGKIVEREFYQVDGVFVGYVEDIEKSDDQPKPTTQVEALQTVVSALKKLADMVKKHETQLQEVATVAKAAKETAERTVLVDARGLDNSLTGLTKAEAKDQTTEDDIWAGLLPELTQFEQRGQSNV